jgi:hypothetical protein
MLDTWLSRLRDRIKRHPVVSSSVAVLTSLGVILRWLRYIIDWVSRWDTWTLHSQRVLHDTAAAAAKLPPGTSEVCYVIAVIIFLIAASRKTTETPKDVVTVGRIGEPTIAKYLRDRERESLELRKLKAEAEVAETRAKQARESADPREPNVTLEFASPGPFRLYNDGGVACEIQISELTSSLFRASFPLVPDLHNTFVALTPEITPTMAIPSLEKRQRDIMDFLHSLARSNAIDIQASRGPRVNSGATDKLVAAMKPLRLEMTVTYTDRARARRWVKSETLVYDSAKENAYIEHGARASITTGESAPFIAVRCILEWCTYTDEFETEEYYEPEEYLTFQNISDDVIRKLRFAPLTILGEEFRLDPISQLVAHDAPVRVRVPHLMRQLQEANLALKAFHKTPVGTRFVMRYWGPRDDPEFEARYAIIYDRGNIRIDPVIEGCQQEWLDASDATSVVSDDSDDDNDD